MTQDSLAFSGGKKILLVEDNLDILESIEITLTLKKYQVLTLERGERIEEKALQYRPDLIIMDVMMPGADGYQVCKKLKSGTQTKEIPIILLSAKSQRSEIETGFSAGADRYITKPFRNEELLKTVSQLLGKRPAG